VLLHWRAMVVSEATEDIIRKGGSLVLQSSHSDGETGYPEQHCQAHSSGENYCRAYNLGGRLLGVLRFNPETRQWQPKKVLL